MRPASKVSKFQNCTIPHYIGDVLHNAITDSLRTLHFDKCLLSSTFSFRGIVDFARYFAPLTSIVHFILI